MEIQERRKRRRPKRRCWIECDVIIKETVGGRSVRLRYMEAYIIKPTAVAYLILCRNRQGHYGLR